MTNNDDHFDKERARTTLALIDLLGGVFR